MKYSASTALMRTGVIPCFSLIMSFSVPGSTSAGSDELFKELSADRPLSNRSIIIAETLPLRLVSFNARNTEESSILLEWKTIGENNTDYFDIERSTDAITFTRVGSMKAAGEDPLKRSYSFTDRRPTSGNNYYRLAMFDLDGTIKYSATQVIKAKILKYLNVLPNPVRNSATITVSWKPVPAGAAYVTVYGQAGSQFYKGKLDLSGQAVIPVRNWPAGIYHIMLDNGISKEFSRLLVGK